MNYGRTAGYYHWLERLSFGDGLRQARIRHLKQIRRVRHALLLGEGNGSFLIPFMEQFQDARITVFDESQVMLEQAARRLRHAGLSRERVNFVQGDALCTSWPQGTYDFVASVFFFDNFKQSQVDHMIRTIHRSLTEEAQWLQVDFSIPESGWAHWRARLWMRVLYLYFRQVASVDTDTLPEVDTRILDAGFSLSCQNDLCGGLLRSSLFRAHSQNTEVLAG